MTLMAQMAPNGTNDTPLYLMGIVFNTRGYGGG